jgi:ferredoxin
METPYSDGLMIVGTAARLIGAWGLGIFYAAYSGKMAAEAYIESSGQPTAEKLRSYRNSIQYIYDDIDKSYEIFNRMKTDKQSSKSSKPRKRADGIGQIPRIQPEMKEAHRKKHKVLITETCVGCTHCAVICPTRAIKIVPSGINVISRLCVNCGYCQMACTVDGIRVIQENQEF